MMCKGEERVAVWCFFAVDANAMSTEPGQSFRVRISPQFEQLIHSRVTHPSSLHRQFVIIFVLFTTIVFIIIRRRGDRIRFPEAW